MAIKCVLCGGAHTQSEHFAAMRKGIVPKKPVTNKVEIVTKITKSIPDVVKSVTKVTKKPPILNDPVTKSVTKSVTKITKLSGKDRVYRWRANNREKYNAYMRNHMKKDLPEVPFTTA